MPWTDIVNVNYVNEEGEEVFDKLGITFGEPNYTRWQRIKIFLRKAWVITCNPFVVYRFYRGVKKLEPAMQEKDAEAKQEIKERLAEMDKFRNRRDPYTGVMYHPMSDETVAMLEMVRVDQYAHVPHEVEFDD